MKKKRMIMKILKKDAENSEAASIFCQTTSFETEVQEREPWDFYEWITKKIIATDHLLKNKEKENEFDQPNNSSKEGPEKCFTSPCLAKNKQVMATQSKLVCLKLVFVHFSSVIYGFTRLMFNQF
jgi:hypothetical protein